MDKLTLSYRKTQIDQVKNDPLYSKSIKICGTDGNTNFLNITEEEFEKIKNVLLHNI